MATESPILRTLAFSMKVGTLAWVKLKLTKTGKAAEVVIEGSDVTGMPDRAQDIPRWGDNYFRGIDPKSCLTHVAVIDTSSQVHMAIAVALAIQGFHVFKIRNWAERLRHSKNWYAAPKEFERVYPSLFDAHKHQLDDGSFRCPDTVAVAVTIGSEYLKRRHSGDLEGIIELLNPRA